MDRLSLALAKSTLIIFIGLVTSAAIVYRPTASPFQVPQKLSGLKGLPQLNDDEISKLKAGEPVTKILDPTEESEVGVFGAEWIDAPLRNYLEAFQDIERFEKGGGFKMTKRISDPARPEDFAALNLTDEDIADLKTCHAGDCDLKLGKDDIARFQGVTGSTAANALFRQVVLEYVRAYQQGGNAKLPVYWDSYQPTSVAKQFAAILDEMSPLLQSAPVLRRYLLEYPKARLSKGSAFFYWQQVEFGLKPTIRVNHVAISEEAENTIIASKLLYANHYFRAALELQILVPDSSRGPGFWLVTVKRLRSDGLSGTTGQFVRIRVERDALKGLNEALRATKSRMRQSR